MAEVGSVLLEAEIEYRTALRVGCEAIIAQLSLGQS